MKETTAPTKEETVAPKDFIVGLVSTMTKNRFADLFAIRFADLFAVRFADLFAELFAERSDSKSAKIFVDGYGRHLIRQLTKGATEEATKKAVDEIANKIAWMVEKG